MSEKMKQGETYEEQEAGNNEDEEKSNSLAGNTKMIAIFAVAGIIILVLIVILFSRNINKEEESPDEVSYSEEMSEDEQDWEEFVASQEEEEYFSETDEEFEEPLTYITFTEEETKDLRKWGYTGDEIEYYQNSGIDYETLIDTAMESAANAQQEIINKLSDKASDDYKKLMKMTWLAGKEIKLKEQDLDDPEAIIEYEIFVENADYVKCEPRGNQLFIRITLNDGTYAFMTVPPERWVTMKKKGNIVVQYNLETYGKSKVITEMSEIEQGVDDAFNGE